MTHHSNTTTDRSSDKHGSGAVTNTPGSARQVAEGVSERVTTNQVEQKTVEVPQEQIVKTTPTAQ